MDWERVDDDPLEWERADGLATVRVRERAGGGYVVRADRLAQAPEGDAYRRERAPDREAALALAAELREAFAGTGSATG